MRCPASPRSRSIATNGTATATCVLPRGCTQRFHRRLPSRGKQYAKQPAQRLRVALAQVSENFSDEELLCREDEGLEQRRFQQTGVVPVIDAGLAEIEWFFNLTGEGEQDDNGGAGYCTRCCLSQLSGAASLAADR